MYTVKGETDHRPRLDAWDKRSDLVLWEDLEGVGGEEGGRGNRDGEDLWTQGFFISMYDRIHYKKKKKNFIFFHWWKEKIVQLEIQKFTLQLNAIIISSYLLKI